MSPTAPSVDDRGAETHLPGADAGAASSPALGLTAAFKAYVAALCLPVLALLPAGLAAAGQRPAEAALWLLFLVLARLLTITMRPGAGIEVSLGAPVAVASAVVLPPELALALSALGFISEREWRRQASPWSSAFNRAQCGAAAGLAALAAGLVEVGPAAWRPAVATAVAALVYNAANTAFVAVALWTRHHSALAAAASASSSPVPGFAAEFGLVTLLAVLIVVAYGQVGVLAVVLLAIPMGVGFNAMRTARQSEDRAERLAEQVRELESLNALSRSLLASRRLPDAVTVIADGLGEALGGARVAVVSGSDVPPGSRSVGIPGGGALALAVPADLEPGSLAIARAAAGLLGISISRLELQAELAEVQAARAALSGQIIEEGTRERSRIALEIHDAVLPYLAAAEIQADNVRSALDSGDPVRAAALTEATSDAVAGGVARLRGVLEDLRNQIVVPGSLRPALQAALEDLQLRHGVEWRLDAPDELPEVPLAVEILLLETVRGCLANVARHAGAQHVEVRLRIDADRMRAEVCDDGAGFEPGAVPAGHQGLALMAQRLELARGRFEVRSAPGSGATVRVEVPL